MYVALDKCMYQKNKCKCACSWTNPRLWSLFPLWELLQWLDSSSLLSVDYQCHPLLVCVWEMSVPPDRPIGHRMTAGGRAVLGPWWRAIQYSKAFHPELPHGALHSDSRALILTSHKHSAYSECIFTTEGVGARGFFWQLVGKGGSVKWLPRRIRCLLCRTIFWHLLVRHIQTQITHLDRNGNRLVVQNEFLRGIY